MDAKVKADNLKIILDRYAALGAICKLPEYQNHLKPILQEAFQNKWPDPTQAKGTKEFHKQYTEQYGRAMAYKELFNMIEGGESMAKTMAEQIASPKKTYGME